MPSRERVGGRRAAFLAVSIAAHVAAAGWLAAARREPPAPRAVRVQIVPPAAPRPAAIPFPSAVERRTAPSPSPSPPRRRGALARTPPRPGPAGAVPSAPIPAQRTPGLAAASGDEAAGAVAFAGDVGEGMGGTADWTAGWAPRRGGEDAGPAGPDSSWLRRHLGSIQRRIQGRMDMRPYPLQARRMWWTGNAEVTFVVATDGSVRDARVTRSTGHEVLDRRALESVVEAAPFPRPPVDQEVVIFFLFRLT
jgi:protein TonB